MALDKIIGIMIHISCNLKGIKEIAMNKHIKNILAGMGQALVLSPSANYERPSRSGFKNDVRALKKDSKNVAKDLRKVSNKYE